MNQAGKTTISIWLLGLLTMLFAVIFSSMPVLAAEGQPASISLEINQGFSVENGTPPTDTFNYKLTALDEKNPMPEDSQGGEFSFSIKGSAKHTIGAMLYQSAGIYSYKLEQSVKKETEGYTYDKRTYEITVYVKSTEGAGRTAELIIKNEKGEKVSKIDYQNSYDKKEKEPVTKKPGIDNPKGSGIGTSHSAPIKTGDTSNIALWTVLALTALVSLLVIIMMSKRNKRYCD